MEDQDIQNAKNFFRIQRIHLLDIKKSSHGAFDIFEIYPQFGVRSSLLTKNLNDFALYLGCIGKPEGEIDNFVGCFRIKLQRREIELISLSEAFSLLPTSYILPMIIGCTAEGQPLLIDQSEVPNTLVAGAPGSGKSTLLKVMIENYIQSNITITIIDPKMVDFAEFSKRKGCKVESDISNVPNLLDDIILKMDQTYSVLSKRGFSSIIENNQKSKSKISPQVIIIDEWGNLMLDKKEVLNKVLLLSQKGRAAGISIILATQRPSSSVLPGKIKANFSGRIAMRVSSEMESRIILDSPNAAHISEPGMAYYMDQNYKKPLYFKVALNDLKNCSVSKPKTFWQNIMDILCWE